MSLFLTSAYADLAYATSMSCQEVFSGPVHSADSSLTPQTKELVQHNRFNTWRDLGDYQNHFGQDFNTAVTNLNDSNIWVDAGAGLARAQLQYLQHFSKQKSPLLIAAALTYPKTRPQMREVFDVKEYKAQFKAATQSQKLIYAEGDIVTLGTRLDLNGKVQLLTDDYGPATYADLSRILKTYGNLLSLGGVAYINMPKMTIQRPDGTNGYHYQNVPIEKFFEEIQGFDINLSNPDYSNTTTLILTRNKQPLSIPQLLSLGVNFGSWGRQNTAFEWVQTLEQWKYSRFNPEYQLYQGFEPPADFTGPQGLQ